MGRGARSLLGVDVRASVATRLVVVALVVASVAGTAAYVRGRKAVDAQVLELALDQARSLSRHLGFLAARDPAAAEALRHATAEHVQQEHVGNGRFVVIELYDTARALVVDATEPTHLPVHAAIETEHASLLRDEPASRWLTVGPDTYLQVFAPLRRDDATAAYFEGVYEVDPTTLGRMNRGIVESVATVVVAIFATAAALYPVILLLNRRLLRLSSRLAHANMALLASLGNAVAKRDRETNAHSYRVTIYAIRLAEAIGLSAERIRALVKGAFLHDVGKIAVADAILLKPGPLTPAEKETMQGHVLHGREIVGSSPWLEDALDVVQFHHEKVDGTGYPTGARGDQIPIAARVFAIVDVFDALTSRRPYKEAAPLRESLARLREDRGTSFDPDLVDAFLDIAPALHARYASCDDAELARALDALLVEYFGVSAHDDDFSARCDAILGLDDAADQALADEARRGRVAIP